MTGCLRASLRIAVCKEERRLWSRRNLITDQSERGETKRREGSKDGGADPARPWPTRPGRAPAAGRPCPACRPSAYLPSAPSHRA
eukprot:1791572-Rhodomonas_salina.1